MGWLLWYIICVLSGICIICYFNKFDSKQTEMIALIVTIFGIFLAVSDEFCCQYDYEPNKIINAILNDIRNTNDTQISDLAGNDTIYQKIFFILDVSESTKTKVTINESQKNDLNHIITKIYNSGFKTNLPIIQTQELLLSELLRIHLFSILIDMQNSKSKFSIITFDEHPNFLSIDKQFNDGDLKSVFETINTVVIDGKETNFKTLFDFLESKVKENDNPFQKDKNTLVFLSDFIHESSNPIDGISDSIKAVLNRLDEKSIHLDMIGINHFKKPKDFISISEKIEEILPDRYKIIDANQTTIKLELSNHICENPLCFYYKNRLHEKKLLCNLYFKNTPNKNYRFRLKNNNERPFYQIIYGTDTFKLTNTPIPIKLTSDNKISILMRGHIVSQQFTPVLFIEDLTDNYSYSIGMVFYKELSKTSKILGSILLGMIVGFIFRNTINRRWHKIKRYLIKKEDVTLIQKD